MDFNAIKAKEAKLEDTRVQLKREFFGIDQIIDGVIDAIAPWYILPHTVRKPVVINLWGMTGCGKTSLVRRLCELLEISQSVAYYNLAKISEDTSDDMESTIDADASSSKLNQVFVFDEFQYAATIAKDGKEDNSNTAMKTIWEVIDTGKLYTKLSKYIISKLSSIHLYASILENFGLKVEDGKLTEQDRLFSSNDKVTSASIYTIQRWFNISNDEYPPMTNEEWVDGLDEYISNDPNIWVTSNTLAALYKVHLTVYGNGEDFDDFRARVCAMPIEKLVAMCMDLEEKVKKGYYKDYSSSLVFVIGNIDEAYHVSYSMNPDMDADILNEATRKMTMVDIKNALQSRFRNEQIARLGNMMFMYPSFSVKDFNDIIAHYLDQLCSDAESDYGFTLSYGRSVADTIYRESVFPTQGVRPILSGIYDIVATKIPKFVVESIDRTGKAIRSMHLEFDGDTLVGEAAMEDGSSEIFRAAHEFRIDDKRKNRMNETQAVTAVHESGHFVVYARLFGKMPKKLVSNCVSGDASGFMMPPIDEEEFVSAADYINHIAVDLAGYAAEKLVFGDNMLTSGASSDIADATATASRMLRKFGMAGDMANNIPPAVYTYLTDNVGTDGGLDLNCDNSSLNTAIKEILHAAVRAANATFRDEDWGRMFGESSKYLFENTNMPEDVMTSLYMKVPEDKRDKAVRKPYAYRTKAEIMWNNLGIE